MLVRPLVAALSFYLAATGCSSGTNAGSPLQDGGSAGEAGPGSVPDEAGSACETCGGLQRLSPWPSEGHDIRGQRRSAFPGPTSPTVAWRVDSPAGIIYHAPTVAADGTIYVAGYDGTGALRSDGSLAWEEKTRKQRASISIGDDGFIYASEGNLVRMSPSREGQLTLLPSTNESAPLLAPDGTVFVGGAHARAVAAGGRPLWSVPLEGCTYAGYCYRSSPAMAPDGSLRFAGSGVLQAFERDGEVRWAVPSNTDGRQAPAVGDDGTTYLCEGAAFVAIDASGKELFRTDSCAFASPAIAADGTIYLPGGTELVALRKDGSVVFRFPYGENRGSSPAIDSEGTIYVGAGYPDGKLFAIDPSGHEKWSVPLDEQAGSPAIGPRRRLYVPSISSARLIAIGP
ncbi:MAG TPA: PQQ-binding-like beta-propeller repeat protein [Labilithrix sp.]|nr:PQQ-binding-like beta-propeller repeat protein [Labilithrix sp.]